MTTRPALKAIHVTGLFEDRDVHLTLPHGKAISFVHGANGVGKTTLLRLVHALFNLDVAQLLQGTFEELVVELSSGPDLGVRKDPSVPLSFLVGSSWLPLAEPPGLEAPGANGKFASPIEVEMARLVGRLVDREAERLLLPFSEGAVSSPLHLESASLSQPTDNQNLSHQLERLVPNGFREAVANLSVEWIGADRLVPAASADQFAVVGIRKQLVAAMSGAQKKYADFAQQLDRSLPRRLLEGSARDPGSTRLGDNHSLLAAEDELNDVSRRYAEVSADLSKCRRRHDHALSSTSHGMPRDGHLIGLLEDRIGSLGSKVLELRREAATAERALDSLRRSMASSDSQSIEDQFRSIDQARKRLTEVRLLEPDEDVDLNLAAQAGSEQREMLTLYLGDVGRKLEVLQPLASQLELFARLVNEKFDRKHLEIDRDLGYVVNSSPGNQEIPVEQLSSGEQQQLVLLYRLIFAESRGAIFLIDEPELSLHVQWQEQLVDDLANISEVGNAQFLLATHSPVVVGHRDDLMVAMEATYRP